MKIDNLIALRYFKSRKRNSIVSFLSITSIIGLMLGTATLILVVSVMSGFTNNLKEKMMGTNSDIVITDFSTVPVRDYKKLMQEVKKIKGVKAAAPFVNTQAVSMSGSGVSGIIIKGIDADLEKTVSKISSFITFGSLDDIKVRKEGEPYGILLGKDLAFSLMAGVGDTITLISPQLNRGPFGLNPKMRSFIVKGIFDTGVYEYNASMAYVSIEAAQEFIGLKENSVTGISVSAEQGINSIDLTYTINQQIENKYWARDWLSMNQSLFSALELEKYAMFIVLTLIIIVASFSIVSMIAITVKDKQKDIAILRAYGASSSCIRSIFIRQGLIVGIIGTALGNITALLLSILVTKYKLIRLPEDIYFMDSLPLNIDYHVYLFVSVCAVLITFLASLFPSNQSAKMNIVDGIRND
ncbi:MAG: FtsX-like permease family protein [Mucispirillum sp.]|nr:FtsX-like permease family protein [Mucispirillum sp.]